MIPSNDFDLDQNRLPPQKNFSISYFGINYSQEKILVFLFTFLTILFFARFCGDVPWQSPGSPSACSSSDFLDSDFWENPSETENMNRISPAFAFELDLNCASSLELSLLPGIGGTLAQKIVDYREKMGPFQKKEDVMKINGIGPKKYQKMLPYLKEI